MFLKKLIDINFISEKFILEWSDKKTADGKEFNLDKDSCVRDKKAERKFREGLLEDFINWLK